MICRRGIGEGLPVFKLFVLVKELDRNVAIFFLQDGCPALIQRLNLVDDCIAVSANVLVVRESRFGCW